MRDCAETVRQTLDRDDAIRITRHELPDVAAAYAAGEWKTATARQVSGPVRLSADPSVELMRLVGLTMTAEHVDVDQATKAGPEA